VVDINMNINIIAFGLNIGIKKERKKERKKENNALSSN
jgi:hypothetical protein